MKENERVFMKLIKEGFYEISEIGKIFMMKIKTSHGTRKIVKREIRTKVNGYVMIKRNFTKENKRIHIYAHRLVWIYFNGPIPEGMEVNHKKGIRDDNRPSQLELMTRSQNIKHGYDVLGNIRRRPRGEKHGNSKLSELDVIEIKKHLKKESFNLRELGKMFGVEKSCILSIKKERTWRHI